MGLILGGLLFTVGGLSMIFARDFWWEMQELGNQWEGQASERSDLWGCHIILAGIALTGGGLASISLGIHEQYVVSQPVVPGICSDRSDANPANKSEFDRYIKIGCTAAQKKEYQIASTNFKQALAIRKRDKDEGKTMDEYFTKTWSKQSDVESVNKAIEQMNAKLK